MSQKSFFIIFLLLLTNILEAQAPGNVTATFPLWLKANAGTSTTTDGVGVQTWTDQATALGGTNSATQATLANRPFYKNLTPMNFNPYIRFDGVNDVFGITSNTSINQVNSLTKSVYYTFRTGSSVVSPTRQLIYKERNHQSGFNLYLFNGNLYCSAFKTNTAPTWPWKGANTPAVPNTTYIISFIMNGTAANAGTIACYINSFQYGNLTGVGQIQSVNATSNIGARQLRTNYEGVQVGNANTDYSVVDMAEIAYYNAAHSAADRNKIESYLAVKYGVTLNQTVAQNYTNSAGTVIYNATGTHNSYRNDIAGIMVDTNSALNQTQSKSVNTDAIVTMSTASAMANTESLLWGNDNDDNGVIQEIYTGLPGGLFARTDRVWRVDQTGDVGTVSISFNLNGIPVSGTTAADFRLLVDSANSDFTAGATQINAASYSGGIVTFNNVDFTGDDYFTLVTLVSLTPPTVTLTTNAATIIENGGIATLTATLSNIWTSPVIVNLGFSGSANNLTDYVRSGTSITIPASSLSGSITITAQDDAFSEGSESVITDITSVSGGGTENGVQQVTVNITDDEPTNNACDGQERLFTTELASGDVNTYNISGVYQSTSTSAFTQNFEMIIDPDNNYRYLASYGNLRITRANFDGTGEITLFNTALYSPNPPFQVTINQNQGKIYWTDWAANTANIFCANLDGTGTPVAIATGLNYPTGMQIDKNTGRLFVYFGLNAPASLARTTTDGNCSPITLTTIANTGLALAYNLTIDPPGDRLFFVDFNSQTIRKIDTDGTDLVTLRTLTAPGDQMRDIVYNKNTDNLFWVHTNGVIQRALASGVGGITTVVASGFADSRSIDICVDDAPPRLTSFYSTTPNGSYGTGSQIVIRAVYDEAVIPGGTLTVTLSNGAVVVLNNINGNEISGVYTIGTSCSGQDTADLTVVSISAELVSDSNNNDRVNSPVPASPNNLGDTSNISTNVSFPNWPAPHGMTHYYSFGFESTFTPSVPGTYQLPSGDDFDDYLGRNQTQKDQKRDAAYDFFLSQYGLDFANDGVVEPEGIFIYENAVPKVLLRHISYDDDFGAKISAASGYLLDDSLGTYRAGIYQVITYDTGLGGTNLTGAWGGAGTLVPFGTVLEYGEYELDLFYKCFDGIDFDQVLNQSTLVTFQSQKPSLADFNQENQGQFLDTPQLFEYDIIDSTNPSLIGGEITGRTEIRQDSITDQVTAISNITLTVLP